MNGYRLTTGVAAGHLNALQCQPDTGCGAAYKLELNKLNHVLVSVWQGKVPSSLRMLT